MIKLSGIHKRIIRSGFYFLFIIVPFFIVGTFSELLNLDLDTTRSRRKATMVVARYRENLNWLKKVPWEYTVYNKGNNLPKWVKNQNYLQNVGRESHSYLPYIIDNYYNLPGHVMLVQGDPFFHSAGLIKKINGFNWKDDFFPLSDQVRIDGGHGNPNHPGLKITESAQILFASNIESFEFPVGAQFIVSRKAILFHTKLTYQKIREFLIKAEPPPGEIFLASDDPECRGYRNLFSAWTMERLWMTLFDGKHKAIYDYA